MPKVSFSESDAKAGFLVQNPDWYRYQTITVKENPARSGESTNYFAEVRGLSGEMKDTEFTKLFNTSKGFRGMMVNYFKACNGGKELTPGDYDFEQTYGIEWEGWTVRGKDQNGNPVNDIVDFRPAR